MCVNWRDHEWQKIGVKRVPAHGRYYPGMSLEPTGTVAYEQFRCRHCPAEAQQERPYSYL